MITFKLNDVFAHELEHLVFGPILSGDPNGDKGLGITLDEGLPERIEDELCYFLGFRIIEKYTQSHGEDSWKDICEMPLKEFYLKSGYKEYIDAK